LIAQSDKPLQAERTSEVGQRAQRLPMIWLGPTAASYMLDTLFLGLFAWAGTIQPLVPAVYGIGGFVMCGSLYVMFASGWNQRFRDPGLVSTQALVGVALQLAVVALAPQIAFPYLANIFTVFAFAMIWLPIGESVLVWLAGVFATGFVFYGVEARFGIPTDTPFEMILVWLYFVLTLGRCVVLSIHAAGMRERLFESRKSLRASLEQIQQLVRYDELTKLFNRRSLLEHLQQEKSRADRTGIEVSIALFDIDHFKRINDDHGHAAGDEALKEFAGLTRSIKRDSDVFGRYGGEEFMLILPATPLAAALKGAERLRLAVAATDWSAVAPGPPLTVSAGVACYRKGEGVEQLISRADVALYQAKGSGRNQVRGEQASSVR
jgi:diguanylate cyclase (GGDEF)-like protein